MRLQRVWMQTPEDILKEITGDGQLGKIFRMIEITEEEIELAMQQFPQRAEWIYNSFMMFQNEAGSFSNYDLQLWRFHCRELLERVGNPPSKKEQRELGTRAMAMVAFVEASLIAPLNEDGTMAYAKLFGVLYGEVKLHEFFENVDLRKISGSYAGAVDEMIGWTLKRMSKPFAYPTQEYLDEKRNETLSRGRKLPWMKYTKRKAIQIPMEISCGS